MRTSLFQYTKKSEYGLLRKAAEQRMLSLSGNSCVYSPNEETSPLLFKCLNKTMMVIKLISESIKYALFFKNDDSDMMNEDDKHQLERSLYEYRYIK